MNTRPIPRYVLVAATCQLLNTVILVGVDALSFNTVTAVLTSFVIVLTCGYLLHCRVTFHEHPTAIGFARYGAGMAVNIPVAFGALYLLHDMLALPMVFAGPLVSLGMLIVNYVLSYWAIARPSSPLEKNR
jgi:putative flippase GtrA